SRGATFLLTLHRAPTPAALPIVTPRKTIAWAPSHTSSEIVIGALSNSNVGENLSWLPAHRNTPWEMHTSWPILIGSRFSTHASSPIQQLSPIANFQGHSTRTRC